jgi:hypothetical protein
MTRAVKRSEQRRDHKPVPGPMRQGITTCAVCGDRMRFVHGYGQPDYWRHWRQTLTR